MGRDAHPWYRAGKRCWFVSIDGKQHRLHADKATAFRLWHEMLAGDAPGEATVADVVRLYLDDAAGRLAASTLRTKRGYLGRLAASARFGMSPASTLDARAWLDRHARWGRSTRWIVATTIKAAWRWAASRKPPLIACNPLDSWRVPGALSRGREALVSPEAHAALLDVATPCYHDALSVLHATGMRPSEVCAVEARHIVAGVVVLDAHKTAGKTGRPRVVILPPAALDVIARLADRHPSGPLFRNAEGGPLTVRCLSSWYRRACRRVGVSSILYAYRHTLATDALAAGVPDAQVAALLGHANTTTLHRHYSHLTARLQALKEAASRVRPD